MRRTILETFWIDDNKKICYIETKWTSSKNIKEGLLKTKQALLDAKIAKNKGYKVLFLRKNKKTLNEYQIIEEGFSL